MPQPDSGPLTLSADAVAALPLRRRWLHRLMTPMRREGARIHRELAHVGDVLPLLLQHRNGKPWTREERRILQRELRRLWFLSPYLLLILLPGSVLLLPLFAWLVDRRHQPRKPAGR